MLTWVRVVPALAVAAVVSAAAGCAKAPSLLDQVALPLLLTAVSPAPTHLVTMCRRLRAEAGLSAALVRSSSLLFLALGPGAAAFGVLGPREPLRAAAVLAGLAGLGTAGILACAAAAAGPAVPQHVRMTYMGDGSGAAGGPPPTSSRHGPVAQQALAPFTPRLWGGAIRGPGAGWERLRAGPTGGRPRGVGARPWATARPMVI